MTDTNLPAPREPMLPASMPDMNRLYELAIGKGIEGVQALERMVALHEKMIERQAAVEFFDAFAGFQAVCPTIPKNGVVKIVNKTKGTSFSYTFAKLDDIDAIAKPILSERHLAYKWDSAVSGDGRVLTITCTLRHVSGHSESATFTCPVEASGIKSAPQEVASSLTFGRRQSLIQVLGIATTDRDDDARRRESTETITAGQAADLRALADSVSANHEKFLVYMRAARYEDIPASEHDRAVKALEAKR